MLQTTFAAFRFHLQRPASRAPRCKQVFPDNQLDLQTNQSTWIQKRKKEKKTQETTEQCQHECTTAFPKEHLLKLRCGFEGYWNQIGLIQKYFQAGFVTVS